MIRSSRLTDTPLHIQRMLIEGYRQMTPAQKMRCVSEINKTAELMALARIRKQYGAILEREQMLRLAALRLDRETMVKVFHWDPLEKGY